MAGRFSLLKLAGLMVCAVVVGATSTAASAQCVTQVVAAEGRPGVSGHVQAMTIWDPDGDGPAAPVLVVGGSFVSAGTEIVRNVAAWDGSVWRAIGDGMAPGYGYVVNALTVYRGELIAAGEVLMPGGYIRAGIARWVGDLNSGNWEPLDDDAPEFVGKFYSLVVFQDQLVVGGDFRPVVGTGPADLVRIASWDGTTWRGFDGGMDRVVNAMCLYRGELIAGGKFSMAGQTAASAVARWDGAHWQPLEEGLGRISVPVVNALVQYRGRLIAAGAFTSAGDVPASSIASWNGEEWSSMAFGLENGSVQSLSVLNGQLYVGGTFNRVGGIDANRVAIWSAVGPNANRWVSLGEGVNALSNSTPLGGDVRAMTPFDGRMFVGGIFRSVGGLGAAAVGAWDEASWQSVGIGFNAEATELTTYSQELIAAGGFTIDTGDGVASGIARWDGVQWSRLGGGLGRGMDRLPTIAVTAIGKYQGELFVAGDFTRAGDAEVGGIARWNGSRWASVGTGVPLPPVQLGGVISGLQQYQGELYAAGGFREIDGVSSRGIASWNGERWRTIEGVRTVHAEVGVTVFQGELYFGGVLKLDGHELKSRVISWDGLRWQEISSKAGMRGGSLLAVHQGELYSARYMNPGGMWVWNGATWRQIPAPPVSQLRCLTSAAGKLIVSGLQGTACWDGHQWRIVSAINEISSVVMFRGELAVGRWNAEGDSPYFARLLLAEPLIARQPWSSPLVCVGGSYEFVVGPALGYQDSTYQWRRDGVPLEGPDANERIFTLSSIGPSQAGTYDCVVSNDCGSTTSAAAELRLCPADFDCSGVTNGADVSAFHTAWLAQEPTADFDGDGDVDSQDLVDFVAAWQAGCD